MSIIQFFINKKIIVQNLQYVKKVEHFIRDWHFFYKNYLIKRNILYDINSFDKSVDRSSYDDEYIIILIH